MKYHHAMLPVLTIAVLLSSVVMAQTAGLKKADGMLVNSAGMTVYTFDKDAANSGKSTCNGPCATLWPPVPATGEVAAPYSAITRDDGAKQVAYNGKPLYLYAQDKKPGDHAGDNFKDIWHVVKE